MNRPHLTIIAYCIVISAITGYIVFHLAESMNKKIAVIDAVQLFNDYHMKKELEGKEKARLEMMSKQVDSVSNQLRMAQAMKNETEVKRLAEGYNYLKARLQNEYTQGNQEINEEVWKRLNPVLQEYGKKKNFHLIIGANGMGTVLYNDDYYDATKDVIKYANKRYEEGN
jgi:outer membrane protein